MKFKICLTINLNGKIYDKNKNSLRVDNDKIKLITLSSVYFIHLLDKQYLESYIEPPTTAFSKKPRSAVLDLNFPALIIFKSFSMTRVCKFVRSSLRYSVRTSVTNSFVVNLGLLCQNYLYKAKHLNS